ncbi:hypothetical protein B4102_0831 [Heyndrickxia sporothermodurans]|uniref:YtkA-like domain-containing protein n=1 Tax=Heyndrickxia sporothermodurans TaxID=46224 RepID=A0A150KNT8_9BACI|nr:FixH family protein [Heyndrickxia sporothermodurans]KYC97176.1 hypothetical protein B4102_0831 [Heyndrickxia sporothermodurans]
MKKILLSILFISTLIIAGCGTKDNGNGSNEKSVEPINVVLDLQEKAKVNENIPLSATVTQGKEKVADAAKVEYEVWEEGAKDSSKMIKATNEKNGKYTGKVAFDHDGVYTIQVHVTARDMHMMPKKSVVVGNPDMAKMKSAEEGDHHEESSVMMHVMSPKTAKVGEKADFNIHMTKHNKALTNAQVQIEVWNKANEKKHEWIPMKETAKGEYSGTHTFTKAGNYQFKVHVENKEGLHEHQIFDYEVK